MAKRLVRAKRRSATRASRTGCRRTQLLPERTSGVLAVLYLLFNEGYAATAGADLMRRGCAPRRSASPGPSSGSCRTSPRRSGCSRCCSCRTPAATTRVDGSGELVSLEEQDRARWDRPNISEGTALLDGALAARRPGPYQVQAAIAACHCTAATAADTDWVEIAGLYAELARLMPTPVVELNRAVAVAMADGPAAGLRLVDAIDGLRRARRLPPAVRDPGRPPAPARPAGRGNRRLPTKRST